jgi:hypothetical protein
MTRYNRRNKVDFSVHRSRVFAVPMLGGAISEANPLRSLGLSCGADQAREFNEFYREHGITGAYHERDGTCVLESRQARNDVLKLRGVRDNDAGYGDWAGNH